MLRIAPTTLQCWLTLNIEDYRLKCAIKKAGPFLTLPFLVIFRFLFRYVKSFNQCDALLLAYCTK